LGLQEGRSHVIFLFKIYNYKPCFPEGWFELHHESATPMSMTRELTRLIRGKSVKDDDLDWSSFFVLDTLACALGATRTKPAQILAAVAPPQKSDVARRAFYFGGLSHILELDDLHRTSVTHPGCVVIPAAWALAESLDLGGRAFLEAVLHGYEACARVGNAVGKEHYKVWHNTSTCGPFGSAMAAAALLDLSEDQCVWALGNAGTQSSGLWEFMASGAMSKHLHTARAAESGVLAALLAREGFTGPDTILEGEKGFFRALCPDPKPDAVLASPDNPWELTRSSIKPWPCCRHTHPTIDAAIALHHSIGNRSISEVVVRTYKAAIDVCDRPSPNDTYSAKFSLQHCVAAALTDGRITQSSFDEYGRAKMKTVSSKVTLQLSPEVETRYPDAWGTDIELRLSDGQTLSASREHCKGDPENPVTSTELTVKAKALFQDGGMDSSSAEHLIAMIADLVNDRPVRDLKLFTPVNPNLPT
jgi:2-methylcitrate dehydratase PrpD